MARFLKGIHGAYQGKVGSVIGSSWRGIDYVRSLSKRSNKPLSEAQLMQQAKFGMAVAFLSPIKDLLNLGYSDKRRNRATGYNIAMRHMLHLGIGGDYPEYTPVYEQIIVSKGGLSALHALEVSESSPRVLTLNWEARLNKRTSFEDDSVIIILYNVTDNIFEIYEEVLRSAQTYEITYPESYSGKQIVGWVFVGHRDGVKTSNSQFLGQHTLT